MNLLSKLEKIMNYLLSKTIIYVVLFIIILLIASFGGEDGVIKLIIFGIPVSLVIYFAYIFLKGYIPVKLAIRKGEYIAYSLKEVNNSIEKARDEEQKSSFLVYKAELMNFKGDWQQSLDILRSIDTKSISKNPLDIYYYNCLAFTLLFSEKYDEAVNLFMSNMKMFTPNTNNKNLNGLIRTNLAAFEYFTGDVEESKKMLRDLINGDLKGFYRLTALYLLGMVYLKDGDIEMSDKYFDDAIAVGGETFLPNKIKEVKSKT